jgi:TldD protein
MNYFDSQQYKRILSTALARGGEYADLYVEYSVTNSITFNESKVKSIDRGVLEGVGVRVIQGERTGYAYSDEMDFGSVLEAASVAAYIAAGSDVVSIANLTRENVGPLEHIEISAADVAASKKVDLLLRADDAARSFDARVQDVSCGYSDLRKHVVIVNSDGIWVENEEQLFRVTIKVTVTEDHLRDSGFEFIGGRYGFEHLNNHPPEDAARNAVRQALTRLHAKPAPVGKHPVVVEAGWGGVLVHEGVGHGLEADAVRKGISIYAGKTGERVASPTITIVDDGTIPNGRGSSAVDDEGTPMRRTVLIEHGVLVGFMYDKLNARLMDVQSTGNGRRESFRHPPLPRMRNTYIERGNDDPRQLIRSVKKGVYAKALGGGQVDVVSGNFVFEINEGYIIENGEIGHPIRGATLIGNGPETMQKVVGVGNDLAIEKRTGSCGKGGQYVPVGVGQPTILISEMTVGGTGQ